MFRGVLGHIRRQPVAFVALFVSLGGSAYAAASLPNNSVGTAQLKNGAVTGAKLHSHSVTASKIKSHSLLADDFKAGQLPQGPQGPQGAQGPQGPPGPNTGPAGGDLTGSYPNPSIAPGAVTNSKLANPSFDLMAGSGLMGGGSVPLGGSGSLSVDPTVVQHRVSGTCSSGSAVASINQDGTVGCQLVPEPLQASISTTLDSGTDAVFPFTGWSGSLGASFNPTTGTYTVPATGDYLVTADATEQLTASVSVSAPGEGPFQLALDDVTTATTLAMADFPMLDVNVSLVLDLRAPLTDASEQLTRIVRLTAGDQLQLEILRNGLPEAANFSADWLIAQLR